MSPWDEESLDDLLSRWHNWQQASKVGRGYNDRSQVCGEYRGSRQYDAESGALDDALDDDRSAIVDAQVQEMLHPWRTAIYINARNLATGRSVWQSPRLPAGREDVEVVLVSARLQIANRLRIAGVM